MADTDPSATLAELSTSLTALEQALDPLLATPLQQHLEHSAAADSPLTQARAHILASYVVHDLVWVYLKAAGIEPASHPVMQELERLKGYFGKLKAAQNGQSTTTSSNKPDRPRMQIDKAAANRFISAAISSSRAAVDPNYTPASDDETGSPAAGPSGTHTRFTEAEKEDLDRLLEDHDVSDEEEDSDPDAENSVVEEMLRGARNGLEQAKQTRKDVEAATGTSSTGKKKRKAMDPFAGYDQPKPASATPTKSPAAPVSAPETSTDAGTPASDGKRKRKDVGAVEKDAAAGTGGGELSKRQRKKLRMKKEAAKAGGK
ncbi:hypothetical protein RHOSPDRAFT_31062 [Rhodotorula sp. JG-1b]|nr:hypothetical protein RHOSPDRAFT_31062 [Rhodotorula sp. JG-1b]